MTEQEERQLIVQEALTWQNTPYHHAGRQKGLGVDCIGIILQTFVNVGLIKDITLPPYPMQWSLHRSVELYLEGILNYSIKVDRDPLPGDVVLYKYGRCISHGGIVIDWPTIVHSYIGIGVVLWNSNDLIDKKGKSRLYGVFSFWR